jgi:UDP-N-acetylmuramoyl-tripeptide--D-alanyl-D-alanine ligase
MTSFRWTATDLAAATGGERVCGPADREFDGIGIDSRTIEPGAVFVAIRGERHDGHRFAREVAERGIRGLVLARDALPEMPLEAWRSAGAVCVAVPDTLRALGDLAAWHRRRANVSVVAVTGSNGKTSTRAMMAAVFGRAFPTLATRGNFNNEVGLPLTLFRLEPEHRWAVLELGMNRPGEIARLTGICRPDIGAITNIGPAHLEGLGSLEGVLRAKAELPATMAPGKPVALNADDPLSLRLAGSGIGIGPRIGTDRPTLLFGRSPAAEVRAVDETATPDGAAFTLVLPDGRVRVSLPMTGRFQVSNALAAAAVGHLAGLDPETIRDGLARVRPEGGRMVRIETRRGVHLIDDTYNANPASMAAAIDALVELARPGRRVLAMGDMLELGPDGPALHRETGKRAAAAGVDRIFVCGEFAEEVAAGARSVDSAVEATTGSPEELSEMLAETLRSGDWVLVKGSRGMAMERVLDAIRDRADR